MGTNGRVGTAIVAWLLAIASCGEPTDPDTDANRVGSIAIQVDSVVVEFNADAQIPVLVLDRQGNRITSPSLGWSITNPEIAAISGAVVVRGSRAGRTFARAEKDGIRDSVPVVVRYDLVLTPSNTQIVGLGRAVGLEAVLIDADGPTHGATGEYAWQSRAASIARVNEAGTNGRVVAVAPGTTWIVASAPNGATDSARITVVPGTLRFVNILDPGRPPASETSAGVGLSEPFGASISIGDPQSADPIVVELEQKHPEFLRLSRSELIITSAEAVEWLGLATGTDTIIASANGYASDTLVVRVARPVLRLADVPSTGYTTVRSALRVSITDSLAQGFHILREPSLLRLRVSSSDPSVFDVESDFVIIGGNAEAEYRTVPTGLGTATLTFTDPTGFYGPITSSPITILPSSIVFGAEGRRGSSFEIAMGQHLRQNGAWVVTDNWNHGALAVRVESRNPRLARPHPEELPDSGGTAFYDILAGDTTGTTWLVFTGNGLITDSMSVAVVRAVPRLIGPQTAVVGETKWFEMSVGQSPDSLRFTREAVTFRIVSTDTTVLAPVENSATIPADGVGTSVGVRIVGVGTATVLILDVRTGYERYDDLSATITARAEP